MKSILATLLVFTTTISNASALHTIVECKSSDFNFMVSMTDERDMVRINGTEHKVSMMKVDYLLEDSTGQKPGPMVIKGFNSNLKTVSDMRLEIPRAAFSSYRTSMAYEGKSYDVECRDLDSIDEPTLPPDLAVSSAERSSVKDVSGQSGRDANEAAAANKK